MNIQKKPKSIRRKDLSQIKNVPKIFMSRKTKYGPRKDSSDGQTHAAEELPSTAS